MATSPTSSDHEDTSSDHEDTSSDHAADAEAVARLALDGRWTIGAAESLTSGAVASALGAAGNASTWFRGAVIAYSKEVKFHLLGVPRGPVVSREAVIAMARGARRELGADVAVATTGAGGPDPEDGQPPGTVWIGVASPRGTVAEEHHLDGSPAEVVEASTARALTLLRSVLEEPIRGRGA